MGTLIHFPRHSAANRQTTKLRAPSLPGAPSFLRLLQKGWDTTKPWYRRVSFWLKTAQALALAVAVCFTLGATDAGARYNNLNHRLMCTCSCAEILGECNHVGCPSSSEELELLRAGINAGDSDQKIFDTFAAKYGATVLAAPPASGFNLVAWIAPFAVFAAALLGTILLVRHWSVGKEKLADQPDPDPNSELGILRDRIRHETGGEGGF